MKRLIILLVLLASLLLTACKPPQPGNVRTRKTFVQVEKFYLDITYHSPLMEVKFEPESLFLVEFDGI
ncbi:MAG: hypothetical protein EHM41_20650 [Chloroflexi bacterium]|nr:MAG: hypothetical protein EHM41_20650 [Chloroflexota bacterium]